MAARDRGKQGGDFCSAISCKNARNKKSCVGKSFFTFPRDKERCKRWVQNAGRTDLQDLPPAVLNARRYLLCGDHFDHGQFLRPAEKDRLVWDAVPTLFAVADTPPAPTPTHPPPTPTHPTPTHTPTPTHPAPTPTPTHPTPTPTKRQQSSLNCDRPAPSDKRKKLSATKGVPASLHCSTDPGWTSSCCLGHDEDGAQEGMASRECDPGSYEDNQVMSDVKIEIDVAEEPEGSWRARHWSADCSTSWFRNDGSMAETGGHEMATWDGLTSAAEIGIKTELTDDGESSVSNLTQCGRVEPEQTVDSESSVWNRTDCCRIKSEPIDDGGSTTVWDQTDGSVKVEPDPADVQSACHRHPPSVQTAGTPDTKGKSNCFTKNVRGRTAVRVPSNSVHLHHASWTKVASITDPRSAPGHGGPSGAKPAAAPTNSSVGVQTDPTRSATRGRTRSKPVRANSTGTQTHTQTHTQTQTHTRTQSQTHTHTHTRTRTQTSSASARRGKRVKAEPIQLSGIVDLETRPATGTTRILCTLKGSTQTAEVIFKVV